MKLPQHHDRNISDCRPGSIAMIAMLILGSVGFTLSLGMALRGITELGRGFAEHQSLETLALAEGCMENTLLLLTKNPAYAGGTFPLGDGSCTVGVTALGDNRTISVAANVGQWTRKIRAEASIGGTLAAVTQWHESTD